MKKSYFTPAERLLWGGSAAMIVLAFCLFDRESWLTLAASLVGVTSLIFCAKGNPFGQALMCLAVLWILRSCQNFYLRDLLLICLLR